MVEHNKNAKEALKQIKVINNQIEIKKAELEDIYEKMRGISGKGFEPSYNTGTKNKSSQEMYINKYLEYKEELNADIEKLINVKREMLNAVNKMDNADCIDVIYKRYFQFKKWEEIAAEKNYTYQGICKIHGRALNKLDKILNESVYKS